MTTARQIYDLRKAQRMSQKKFGELLGVSESTIRKWESGVTSPKGERAQKISSMFGVHIEGAALSVAPLKMPTRCNTCWYALLKAKVAIQCDFCALANQTRGCTVSENCTRYKPRTGVRRMPDIDLGGDV